LRLTLALIIPATVGLIVMASPIVRLIFEHGEFNANDSVNTALALRLYLIGLPFASIDLLLVFAFYARQNTLTPAVIGLLSLAAYMVTAIFLLPYYSFFALMIADSVKHLIHAGVSGWLLTRRMGGLSGQRLVQTGLRATVAAALMGVVSFGLLTLLGSVFDARNFSNEFVLVASTGSISAALYLFLAHTFGITEISLFFKQIRQRI
jgi:putative peptidoglycan lipid II flippase